MDKIKKSNTSNVSIPQSKLPRYSLERSLEIPKIICDQFGGKSGEPHLVANALEISPTSSIWRTLSVSATAYGLTKGGYSASEISITDLGKSIIIPTEEGEKEKASLEAVLKPKIINDFFSKYNKAKLPNKNIGVNVLQSFGVPKERSEEAFDIIVDNGKYVGIITETKTGPFVAISSNNSLKAPINSKLTQDTSNEESDESYDSIEKFAKDISRDVEQEKIKTTEKIINNRVFVSHGKNKPIVEQLKEIIKFGKYDPIVSVERESTSKPVSEKVFSDMRSCFAGVIHVDSEGELLSNNGEKITHINYNVLIEIGAALALFRKNNILLVKKGVELPSNLQGLYRCEYEGDKLDYEATMKLLKTFNEFEQPE